jgi:uncharacterized protein (DUF927 family)
MSESGKRTARRAILGAETVRTKAEPWVGTEVSGFEMDPLRGLTRLPRRKEEAALWVSSRFDILARTRDLDGQAHGLLLAWRDCDGLRHQLVVPRAMIANDASDLRAALASGDLRLATGMGARQALLEFLSHQSPQDKARTVARTGWHFGHQGGAAFVLPEETFGEVAGERVLLDLPEKPSTIYRALGTLEDWRREVAARCLGNTRLVLAMSLAFAGALLTPLDEEGGAMQFRGNSRLGKTSALRVAASVWGASSAGSDSFMRSWRTTSNAIEGIALQHSDGILPIDEMGEVNPRDIGAIVYMLANGVGKARAQRTGTTRAAASWRVLVLSTSEHALPDILGLAGETIRAGQEVRFIDIPADAGKNLGLFDTLHSDKEIGAGTPGEFAEGLRLATSAHHGTAGPAFLQWLVPKLQKDRGWAAETLGPRVKEFLADNLEDGASGQVRSVARRFALAAVAGELATEAGITGWPLGTATEAAGQCFAIWCTARGSVEARESLSAVEQVQACIAQHGQARFEVWKDRVRPDHLEDGESVEGADAPPEARAVPHRLGWRRWIHGTTADGGGRWVYYFLPQGWREATQGLDPISAAKVLAAQGFLQPGTSHPSKTVKIPGYPNGCKVYVVSGAIMGGAEAQEAKAG